MQLFKKQERIPIEGMSRNEFASSVPGTSGTAYLVKSIRINSILLYHDEGEKFLYLFDYENKCWHEVELIQVIYKASRATFPRGTKKQGKYPEKRKEHA